MGKMGRRRNNALVVLAVAVLSLSACASQTDAGRLEAILRGLSGHVQGADEVFQSSMQALETLQDGAAPSQVAGTLGENAETLDLHIVNIARLHEVKADEIEKKAVRQPLKQGLRAIYEVYKTRWRFLKAMTAPLRRGDVERALSAASQHKDAVRNSTGKLIQAMGSLSSAKQAAGLSPELPEFR